MNNSELEDAALAILTLAQRAFERETTPNPLQGKKVWVDMGAAGHAKVYFIKDMGAGAAYTFDKPSTGDFVLRLEKQR